MPRHPSRHHVVGFALLTTLAVGCTFGAIEFVMDLDTLDGTAIATDFNGDHIFLGSDEFFLIEIRTATGGHAGHRLLGEAPPIVQLAQDPIRRDAALSLHETGHIVSWDPSATPTILAGPPPFPATFHDIDASDDGDFYVIASRTQNNTTRYGLCHLDLGVWGCQLLPEATDAPRPPRVAVDDERGEVLVLRHDVAGSTAFDVYDQDLQLLRNVVYSGRDVAAVDIDVIEGVVLLTGSNLVAMCNSVDGAHEDLVELPVFAEGIQFAAYPDTATFRAMVRGQDLDFPTRDQVIGIAVE